MVSGVCGPIKNVVFLESFELSIDNDEDRNKWISLVLRQQSHDAEGVWVS